MYPTQNEALLMFLILFGALGILFLVLMFIKLKVNNMSHHIHAMHNIGRHEHEDDEIVIREYNNGLLEEKRIPPTKKAYAPKSVEERLRSLEKAAEEKEKT